MPLCGLEIFMLLPLLKGEAGRGGGCWSMGVNKVALPGRAC